MTTRTGGTCESLGTPACSSGRWCSSSPATPWPSPWAARRSSSRSWPPLAGHFDAILFRALPERTFGTMSNYTLLAVPFFIFMGTVLEKCRLAEQLLETIGILFGRFRGGLALGVIFVGALLAAATGRGGRERHRHGADLAARHAPQRLQGLVQPGRHRGLGHPGPDHPALASSSSSWATRWASRWATSSRGAAARAGPHGRLRPLRRPVWPSSTKDAAPALPPDALLGHGAGRAGCGWSACCPP